ncbi:MAG: 50S ribosomal protein L31e [Nitrososphaerales archaeon]
MSEKFERIYNIPLRKAWVAPRKRRTERAINIIKEFALKHSKAEEVKIDTKLNELLWLRGIEKPPRKITVKMVKEDNTVTVSLAEV